MISVVELTKRFIASRREILAVDRLSFQVNPGEVYGLLGPNGAGKTTTLNMILGLLTPTSGYAEVDGCRSDRQPYEVKSRIGLVQASAGIYQWLTPREQLLFFADLYGVRVKQARESLERMARLFRLAPFLDQRSGTLSTGQKQRVNLARALIHDPPIMLLDEPTRGLDILGSKDIFDYVARLKEERKAVVVCTHRLDEAQRLCDRFGLLNRGRMAMEGTLHELQQQTGRESLAEIFLNCLDEPASEVAPA